MFESKPKTAPIFLSPIKNFRDVGF